MQKLFTTEHAEGAENLKIRFPSHFSFLEKATIFLYISLLSKASAEIPPFPPLKKVGGGGI
jgi:hypothetical protein